MNLSGTLKLGLPAFLSRYGRRMLCLCVAALLAFSVTGCSGGKETLDPDAALASILQDPQFGGALTDVGDSAAYYFNGLPEGTEIKMYTSQGASADCVCLFKAPSANDVEAVRQAAQGYLDSVLQQAQDYQPQEAAKIQNALIYDQDGAVFLLIGSDINSLKSILSGSGTSNSASGNGQAAAAAPAAEASAELFSSRDTQDAPAAAAAPLDPFTEEEMALIVTPPSSAADESGQDSSDQQGSATSKATPSPDDFPPLQSQSGEMHEYTGRNQFRVDNAVFNNCAYDEAVAGQYANLVNGVAEQLKGQTNVYALIIPTAYGITLPDDIKAQLTDYVDQSESISNVLGKMDDSVTKVNCWADLMAHRDEYLYYRTDHHWNGPGAYYAYEAFCREKGVDPYTLDQREEVDFDGFLGTYYYNNNQDQALMPADTVKAYQPYGKDIKLTLHNADGTTLEWDIICDVSSWKPSAKYNTYAGSDTPLAVFENPNVTDGSTAVIVKESYGNALLPFLVDHYSTVYEVDYRYWTGNAVDLAKEVKADDFIFANNVMAICTNSLLGKMSGVL